MIDAYEWEDENNTSLSLYSYLLEESQIPFDLYDFDNIKIIYLLTPGITTFSDRNVIKVLQHHVAILKKIGFNSAGKIEKILIYMSWYLFTKMIDTFTFTRDEIIVVSYACLNLSLSMYAPDECVNSKYSSKISCRDCRFFGCLNPHDKELYIRCSIYLLKDVRLYQLLSIANSIERCKILNDIFINIS
jgi:hypothetical protein